MMYQRIDSKADWNWLAAKAGNARADLDHKALQGGVASFAEYALSEAQTLHIPVSDSANPSQTGYSEQPGTLTVKAFSFTDNGSTYSAAPDSKGVLVGQKDGINDWYSWQIANPYAAQRTASSSAAALLTSMTPELELPSSSTQSGASPSKIDVSA